MNIINKGIRKIIGSNKMLMDASIKAKGNMGKLPDVVIPGVPKCATTTLYDYLVQHPKIQKSLTKEVFFFDKYFDKGVQWYKGYWKNNDNIAIDSTPTYMDDDLYIKRMVDLLPNRKYIVIMREPISRIQSNYNQVIQRGWAKDEEDTFTNTPLLKQTMYADRLTVLFNLVGKENVHTMFFEDLTTNHQRELDKVFDFLDVERMLIEKKHSNKSKTEYYLSDSRIDSLKEIFKVENKKLEVLLDKPLPFK